MEEEAFSVEVSTGIDEGVFEELDMAPLVIVVLVA